MARNESPTKKKQSKATLRALAATRPKPQNFCLGETARKQAVALNKPARKARQKLAHRIKQEPRDRINEPRRLRRLSDSPLRCVGDGEGAAVGQDAGSSAPRVAVCLPSAKAKKGSKGDISKRKQATKVAKREGKARKKAAHIQKAAKDRVQAAKRRAAQEERRVEQRRQEREEARKMAIDEATSPQPPQPSDLDAGGVLNVLEPLVRTIYKIQGIIMATSRDSSFAAASPFPDFIQQKLRKARSIAKMYQERRQGTLSPLEGWALECAQRAVDELEYMERSDEEEGGR